jgi:hypothetical protein
MTKDEARRIAANIVKLLELLKRPLQGELLQLTPTKRLGLSSRRGNGKLGPGRNTTLAGAFVLR